MTTEMSLSVGLNGKMSKLVKRSPTVGDVNRIGKRRFYLYTYTSDEGWTNHPTTKSVELHNSKFYVDGVRVVQPHISTDQITWQQHATDQHGSHFTSGHLYLHSNGLEGHGTLAVGTSHTDAVALSVFATVVPTVQYETFISNIRYPRGTSASNVPADGWLKGLALNVGFEQKVGSSIPSPVITLGNQDISEQATWSVDGNNTVLRIELNSDECSLFNEMNEPFYQIAYLSFDALTLNPVGIGGVKKYCNEIDDDNQVWIWNAKPVISETMVSPIVRELEAMHLLDMSSNPLTLNELITILPDEVVNDDANTMLIRNMKWAMGESSTESKWLSKFMGQTPPSLNTKEQSLVKQSLNWYQDKFAMAYMTQSFNSYDGPGAPSKRLNTTQAEKLTNYLKSGLAADTDFNIQHQGIYVDAYIGTKPRLQDYLNDPVSEYVGYAKGTVVFSRDHASSEVIIKIGTVVQNKDNVVYMTQSEVKLAEGDKISGPIEVLAQKVGRDSVVGENTLTIFDKNKLIGIDRVSNPDATTLSADKGGMKWAKKLFDALTSGSQYILMVNRVAGAAGDPKALGPVNNLACLLTVLDESGTIANNYFQSILSGAVIKAVPDVVHRDKAAVLAWLPTAMQEMFRKLAAGELPEEVDISQQEALEIYQEYQKHMNEINIAVADLLTSIMSSGLISQARNAEGAFIQTIGQRWPKLAKASRLMFALGWIGAVSSVIVALTKGDWSKMTDIERAELVTNITQMSILSFDAVPLIWQGIKSISLSIWNKINDIWRSPTQQVEIEMVEIRLSDQALSLPAQQAENLSQALGRSGGAAEGTIFERIFAEGIGTGILKCLGALTAAAMAGYTLWQLIDDIKNNGSISTQVFDSLIFAANCLSAACLIIDLFVVTSCLATAGAVLAIVGIVLGIIAAFLEKPANPIDDWMEDYAFKFVDSLPVSTKSEAAALRVFFA